MFDSHPWQTPPAPIAQILNAASPPSVYVSPNRRWLLELEQSDLCAISDLAEPDVAIAGFRINPRTHAPARQRFYDRVWIQNIEAKTRTAIDLPDGDRIDFLQWSPNGEKLAFTLTQPEGLELWVLEVAVGKPWRVTEAILNATYGTPYRWHSNEAFLCKVISSEGEPPTAPRMPSGPSIQENLGQKTPNRTYTNLLATAHDEALFEYYVASTLEQVLLTGERTQLLSPSLIAGVEVSPDGQYILLGRLHRPFSYQVPAARFPRQIQVLDTTGKVVYEVADLPLDEQRSIKFDAVRPGRRQVTWRSDRPATLFWVEALDDGDPSQDVPHRDRWLELDAPFANEPRELWRSQYRFWNLQWGRDDVALAWERDYDSRQTRLWRIRPNQPDIAPTLLSDRSFDDQYRSPGVPVMQKGAYDRQVLQFTPEGQGVYFKGRGASPQGVYPFLDQMDLATGQTERLWQCQDPYFETVEAVLDADAQTLVTRRQSQTEPPNYFLRSTRNSLPIPLTQYADSAPQFAGVQKELVQYQRSDGVSLSATLYLPAHYDPQRDGALPMVFWVYPAEFKDRELAGQNTTAENTFSRPSRASVLFLLTQGYAVLSDPKLPIIGEGDAEPNDTYVEQLIAGAEAAVDYVVQRGVADRDRLGIGGHSYGAFTTANLLAHTNLFKLGIARSGAYNRTLTPFGFQGEQRNFWEAVETYQQMAPFTQAAKIKAPLLLIHGANDSNAGTYPLQTERFYEALKGLGATVRWVELPLEDHGYQSKEAVGHVLWEMVRWCDRYLKS
ncbi:MAG: prolyl oligopeptidase family serine peptidase [Myxacorys chilensis ATA2-1-KO14]|jgi:dipeptidyl aminopeptidase/acylaminoacyl peptidase|nr:prolyl oligopeptidase family serine peptidase [Myxacorys chilensis ATA2-1-KO14]